MTPPVKPYKIVRDGSVGVGRPGRDGRKWSRDIVARDGGLIGAICEARPGWWIGLGIDGRWVGEARLITEAAALVYQAWLDRTSEGMKK